MNLDRDLNDALRPLAGDPIADAARVLAALPGAPPSPSPRHRGEPRAPRPGPQWLPWVLLPIASVLGGVLGRALFAPAAATVPTTLPDSQKQPEPRKEELVPRVEPTAMTTGRKREPQPVPGSLIPANELVVMAFGDVEVDEPLSGKSKLEPGLYHTELAADFKTAKSQAGIYIGANDARVRLDFDTAARIDADHVQLEFGRVWIDSGGRGATIRVDCGSVKVVFGKACGVVARAPSGVEVLALSGNVDVDTQLDLVRIAEHEKVTVEAARGSATKSSVPFPEAETSWMTRMVEEEFDRKELYGRVRAVFEAYEQGASRAVARRELLRLGSRSIALLADSIDRKLATDRAYALDAVELVAQIIDYPNAQYALPVLLLGDDELSSTVFRAIESRTGTTGGTDEAFWHKATPEQRRIAVERWRNELSR